MALNCTRPLPSVIGTATQLTSPVSAAAVTSSFVKHLMFATSKASAAVKAGPIDEGRVKLALKSIKFYSQADPQSYLPVKS